ncbi:hypothetical protein AB0D04_35490 [Streptomyces sp. NPDC048483]|uniref:hypothetical protein n=1 Tax=Streptomyces sp. NPDC048483 TaxID=3154927 RepID=UPI00341A6842
MHEKAQRGGHGGEHPHALDDLLALQRLAKKPTDCSGCNKLIKELCRSDAELLTSKSRRWHLERALAACRDVTRRAGFKAGSHDYSSAPRRQGAPLPVPRYRQDRQDEWKDLQAAQAVAEHVKALASEQKHHEVAAALQNAQAVLSPVETAAVVVVLRSAEVNGVAETLLKGYARDLPAHAVMGFARSLLQHGLPADAEAVLHTATS